MAGLWVRTQSGGWSYMPPIHLLSGGGTPRALHEWVTDQFNPEGGYWRMLVQVWVPSAADASVAVTQDELSGGPVRLTATFQAQHPTYRRIFRLYRNGDLWETYTTIAGVNSVQASGDLFSDFDLITADVRFLSDAGQAGASSPLSPPHSYRG